MSDGLHLWLRSLDLTQAGESEAVCPPVCGLTGLPLGRKRGLRCPHPRRQAWATPPSQTKDDAPTSKAI